LPLNNVRDDLFRVSLSGRKSALFFDSQVNQAYDSWLMSNRLPETIKPLHLAETRQTLSGCLPLEKMSRLAPLLSSAQGIVEIELDFGIDEQKIRYAKGHLQTTLNLICQRCFQGMSVPVNAGITLGMVNTMAEADLLPQSYEPLLLSEPALSLLEMIEDELILTLPLTTLHQEKECHLVRVFNDEPAQDSDEMVEHENPFAALERLKKGK